MSRDAAPAVNPRADTEWSGTGLLTGSRGRALAVVAFAALTALGARLSVPLPGLVVPMTLQPVAVLLAGLVLGSRAGATSQALYLAIGATGLPVFAAGGGAAYLLGPTGGYLLAFPVAAALAGLASGRERTLPVRAAWLFLGVLAIHAGGLAWLWITGGRELVETVGVTPFLIGDVLKVVLVLALGRGLQTGLGSRGF